MKPTVKRYLKPLARSGNKDVLEFVAELVKKNPDHTTQAYAAHALSRAYERSDKEKHAEYAALLKEKYSDVFPDLSVGKPAPEIILPDLDGKPQKLSALKGKVVVLDIWATWCGPCRAMIPHEREMVEKLKDKPFALVSISFDEEKQTLIDFLKKTEMPWTHWWNGSSGGISEPWNIQHFPTIYVLDANGIIRYTELRGEKLESAVEKLLTEMDKKGNDKKSDDNKDDEKKDK
jgi:thiol-disulfide isomerase/thioredoxin